MIRPTILNKIQTSAIAIGFLSLAACSNTPVGTTTEDGLVLQADTQFDEVYLRPGVSLQNFAHYGIENCEVSFRKNWRRDQNQQRPDVSNRVSEKNAEEIRQSLSEQCGKHLREALNSEPTLKVVEQFDTSDRVLVLRPSVIDLDIYAPDTDAPGINRSYTRSFGEMTLVLELADANTGQVVGRVVEKRRGHDRSFLRPTNNLTNKFETDRILRRWSEQVRASLDSGLTRS
ncbi:MAG: hypothetical protein AB8C02_17190 [Halioglobus sp.]